MTRASVAPAWVLASVLTLMLGGAPACGGAGSGPDRGEETATPEGAEVDGRDGTRRFWELYRAANDARVAGRRGEAVSGFEAALELNPDHGDALHYLAQLRLERDEVEEARRLLERLVATESTSLRGLQQLAVALGIPRPGWAPDLRAGLRTVERAVRINPGNSGPWVLEARLAAYLGDSNRAREAETEALERVPGHAEAHALSIWRAVAADRLEEAREAARRALQAACADPGSAAPRCADHPRLHLLIASLPSAARPRAGDEALAGLHLPALVAPAAPGVSWVSPRLTVRSLPSSPRVGSGTEAVRVDLDGDGVADLLALGSDGRPARLATAAADPGGPRLLPAGAAPSEAWSGGGPSGAAGQGADPADPADPGAAATGGAPEPGGAPGPGRAGPIPWRGAFLDDRYGRALAVVGGGPSGVRLFRPDGGAPDGGAPGGGAPDGGAPGGGVPGGVWREAEIEGLPAAVPGAVLAAADWNGDGAIDLFLGNLPAQPPAGGVSTAEEPAAGDAPEEPPADMVGRLFLRVGAGRFEPAGPPIAGPLQAALAVDVDGDGDADLLVARKLPGDTAARGQLLLPRSLEGRASRPGALALWRNDAGRLVADPGAVPFVAATVQDLGASDLDGDGLPEVYVAAGMLVPEYPEADRLLGNRDGRFVDISHTLGEARLAGTLRAWGRDRGFELLRGGTVPADARRRLLLTWSEGAEGSG